MARTVSDTVRARMVGPALAIGLLGLLVGCSSGDDAATDTTPSTSAAPATVSTAPASTAPTPTAPAPTTPAPTDPQVVSLPDGPALLDQALAAAAPGYHFVSTVTVGEVVALTAEGDRVGEGTRMAVTSNGVTVGYVLTPEGSWVDEGGSWQELTDPAPVADPIAALRTPSSVTVTAQDGDTTVLVASYPASSLGLTGDAPVEVTLTITAGTVASMRYSAVDVTPVTSVETRIEPLADPSPVTVPTT